MKILSNELNHEQKLTERKVGYIYENEMIHSNFNNFKNTQILFDGTSLTLQAVSCAWNTEPRVIKAKFKPNCRPFSNQV